MLRKKLFNRYTGKGERYFITYATRVMEYMKSETIHKQYKNSMKKVMDKYMKKKIKFEDKRKPKIKMK